MNMKRALVVDNHVIARIGLKVILKEMFPGAQIEEAQDSKEAEDRIRKSDFDLCLLDLNLPHTDSMVLLKQMRQQRPNLRILVISMNNEEIFAISALKNGALGYISKDNEFEVIKEAIKRVLENRKYMSDKMLTMLIDSDHLSNNLVNPFSKLSDRELIVVHLLLNGLTTKQIAQKINLQLSTISTYKGKIYSKLQISNPIELFELSKLHRFTIGDNPLIGSVVEEQSN